MDDETVMQFVSFTNSTVERAEQYLRLTDGDVQQAIDLFFTNDGNDAYGSAPSTDPPNPQASLGHVQQTETPRQRHAYEDENGVVHIDSDQNYSDDNELQVTGNDTENVQGSIRSSGRPRSTMQASSNLTIPSRPTVNAVDEDEAIARRLQEEYYGAAGVGGEHGPGGIRAPIAPTTETLIGSESEAISEEEMREVVAEQMRVRQLPRSTRRGIFNQATTSSIWNDTGSETSDRAHRDRLARATAGASEVSSKSSLLAEMYRPPSEIMSHLPWDEARKQGRDGEKWMLVNVQDPAIFDCQVLNRDIWKNAGVMETVKEHFIFMQFGKDDPRGSQYVQYYFPDKESQSAYPHIAIVDPRTGEQVKVWSGPPVPKVMDFLMQLHEFLDRYSLKVTAKNPVAKRKPELKKATQVEKMTEEQMLEMALQNSLVGAESARDFDPDDLTRSVGCIGQGDRAKEENAVHSDREESSRVNGSSTVVPPSPFSLISSSNQHTEPLPSALNTTRIQFRHPTGRVVRRFLLSDPVRRIYEWLKASPLEGKEGVEFELIFLQKNLLEVLEDTIEQAGLKNGTVMVEFLEE